jgi:hypothetical protein
MRIQLSEHVTNTFAELELQFSTKAHFTLATLQATIAITQSPHQDAMCFTGAPSLGTKDLDWEEVCHSTSTPSSPPEKIIPPSADMARLLTAGGAARTCLTG